MPFCTTSKGKDMEIRSLRDDESSTSAEAQYWEDMEGRLYLRGSDQPFTGTVVEWYQLDQEKLESDYLNGFEHGLGLSRYEADVVEGSVNPLLGQMKVKVVSHSDRGICYRKDGGGEYLSKIISGKPKRNIYSFVKKGNRKRVVYYREGRQLYEVWYGENGYRYKARGFSSDGKLGNVAMFYDEVGRKSFKVYHNFGEDKVSFLVKFDQSGSVFQDSRKRRVPRKLDEYALLFVMAFFLGMIGHASWF